MSMPACGWAVRRAMELQLPTMARATLFVLAEILGATGKLCPSLPYLCARTGLSEMSQRKWLRLLREVGAIDWLASPGNRTDYTLVGFSLQQDVRGSTPTNNDGKNVRTPTRRVGVTPTRRVGVTDDHPHKSEARPPQIDPLTPTRRVGEPLEPRREPKTREDARKEAVGFSSGLKEASKPEPAEPAPEREPTIAEIEQRRREHAEAMAAMPGQLAAVLGGLGAAMRGVAYAPGRSSNLSRDEQADVAAPRLKVRPAPLSREQLAMVRQRAGMIRQPAMAAAE